MYSHILKLLEMARNTDILHFAGTKRQFTRKELIVYLEKQ